MMNYFNGAINYVTVNFLRRVQPVPEMPEAKLSPLDAYLNYFFMIINWEDPKLSWIAFLTFNFIFMLIIYYEVKFYCILFQILLVKCLFSMFGFELKEQPKYISFGEIRKTANGVIVYLRALKRENPSLFCANLVVFFLALGYIGRSISGQLLLYIFILNLFFMQQFIKLIPAEYKVKARNILMSLQNTQGVVAEAELIPYLSNKDFNEDKDGDLDSLLTDKTQDSLSSAFLSGIVMMPSHLEADNVEEIEEEDLLPQLSNRTADYSSDSSSDSEHKNIKFDASHFNGSSDEESKFATGLRFPDTVDAKTLQNLGQSVGAGLYNIGANLLTNVLQSAKQHETQRQDSDSDFEIINSDEADES